MIAIASDHAGFALKEKLKKHLEEIGVEYKDYGTYSTESCDYPVYAKKACSAVIDGECEKAILVCGTGIGVSMAANKIKGIRAAVCSDTYSAKFTRLHNNANTLCMGARVIGDGLAAEITDIFLTTPFEGGKHQRRIDMFE
ncbi:MAG: ribose 5-phosphate isomerase B [Clostridia bacterium]|nr:ribose 5-phosphate isomerase B [Clostridia bacterium]